MGGVVRDITGVSDQDHPHGKKCKKAKWLSEEALKIAVKRSKKKKRKGKIYSFEGRVPKNNKER